MIWGYTVIFTQVCKVGQFPYNNKLYMQIDYLNSDFDAISQEEMLFELNSSTNYIVKMIVEMTSKYQKKIDANHVLEKGRVNMSEIAEREDDQKEYLRLFYKLHASEDASDAEKLTALRSKLGPTLYFANGGGETEKGEVAALESLLLLDAGYDS